ncbi:FAS1-like dehydratase domain-containing protein [Actinophytocola sediminis]
MAETMELATTFGRITDDALTELRTTIGREVRRGQPYIEELNADAIRHFAYGIGDRNPLWVDRDHAESTEHGLLAPPTILYAMDRILSGYVGGLPGVHAMFAGTTFRWSRRLRAGDRLRGTARLKELIERPSRFAGRSVQQIYEVTFTDQHGEQVAVTESYCFRTERDAAREKGKYAAEDAPQWTADQLAEIGAAYRRQEEVRRGATPRRVDQVSVGDELPALLKGPYTATTAVSYLLGWGGLYVRSHGHAFQLYEDHPALAIPNEWGVPEPPERVHWDPDLARRVGVPGAYDYGPERVSWMGHLVTDWMGDDGFLAELDVQVRRHNLIGDLVTFAGTVSEVDTATGRVSLSLRATDQRGEESARGTAVVELPRT